jgi:hypothetical protein
LPDGSGMNREVHVPFCERLVGKFHGSTHHKLHYVKDVSFREDFTRKEQAPINFSILIDIALNILRLNNVKNIKGALYEISLNAIHSLTTFKGIVC